MWLGWIVAGALAGAGGRGVDLAEVYPAESLGARAEGGLECAATLADVWRLRSFELESRKRLRLRFGAADLVVGHHDGSAMWAVVRPDRPGRIDTELAGDGEKARTLLLRFHPARIGELFPARTVSASGDRDAHAWGVLIEGHKRRTRWARNGLPLLLEPDRVVADVDTQDGVRRIYELDFRTGRVEYDGGLVARAVPTGDGIDSNEAGRLFDRACALLRERYLPAAELETGAWEELRLAQRRVASRSKTRLELGVALHALLHTFEDPRLRVRAGDLWLPSYQRERVVPNVHWNGVINVLGEVEYERTLWRSRTPHGVGYVTLGWVGDHTEDEFDEALAALRDTWCLVLDLRQCRGSDDRVAMEVAGRFLDEEVVWAVRRAGAGVEPEEVKCRPRGAWRYRAPVLVLVGRATAAVGERIALVLRRSGHATLLGETTRGSDLFVEWVDLGGRMSLRLPDAAVVDPDGVAVDRGVPVDVAVACDPDAYHDDPDEDLVGVDDGDRDPLLFAALDRALGTPDPERRTAQELAEER